jgi:MFS family permease
MLFLLGSGLSQSLGAQLVCRFFSGFFGGSPFSVVGGSLSDMWDPMQRMIAFPSFACEFRFSIVQPQSTAQSLQQTQLRGFKD